MLLKIANKANIIVKVSKNMSRRRLKMGKAKTKEECRQIIVEQAKDFFREKRTIYVIGQSEKNVNYIYDLLMASSLKHCKFLRGGGKNFLKELDVAQIMLLQNQISGILCVDKVLLSNFEKNLRVEKYQERCFEVPYYFFDLSKEAAAERVIECFSPMNMGGLVNTIQFDITDKCNLNCALCSHFSPLVKEENRYSIEQFTKDARRLKELTEHIGCIGLWGGEALLHPQLDKIIDISREIFKDSEVIVGTNGILIPTISEHILNAIKRNDCALHISGYPPTMKMLDKIESRLKEKEIRYITTPVSKFFKRYELQGDYDITERHSNCGSKICYVIKNGTYSSCYVPFGAQVFNLYFGEKFDVGHSIFDLHDEGLDMISFSEKVKGSLDICRFCGDIEMYPWKVVGKDKDDISCWVNRYDEYDKNLQETNASNNKRGIFEKLRAYMFR